MLNKDMFTPKERDDAFNAMCSIHNCVTCPLSGTKDKQGGLLSCYFAWLDMEYKTSKEMISDLIEEVSGIEIGNKDAKRARIEMLTKLLSHRDRIQQIWQAQDKEATYGK